jgi:hypothetical protein
MPTGSATPTKITGIVFTVAFAATAPGVDETTMRSTFSWTRSFRRAGKRLTLPSAQRSTMATFWPSA